ncbi:MAG: anhydro-N-acetylmuramic acid kinase/N-acetylmuramic acid 6-phosphate etherase [Planctomycetota bacterium]
MTGTSIDGDLDAAIVEIRGRGPAMRARFVAGLSHPLGALAEDLRRIARQEPLPAREFARVARAFGEAHAEALARLAADAGVRPDLAVLHGQTVFHAPPLGWQLLDPWPVAVRLGCRVRYDLRGANLASGGEGAPITPLADFTLFAGAAGTVVMNLGGFINATLLPAAASGAGAIRGFDVCACNHLLDAVARARLGAPFDADGDRASRGTVDAETRTRISQAIAPSEARDETALRPARRSLGTGDEAARLVGLTDHLSAEDACRTVADAIADAAMRVLASEGSDPSARILLAGGSARNRALRAAFAQRSAAPVETTEESHGLPVHMREPVGIAILGALADDGAGYCLPAVTGRASRALDSALLAPATAPHSAL